MAKILFIDIETAPNVAFVWGAFKQFISQDQWIRKGYIMSVAWKWQDEDEVHYLEQRGEDDSELVGNIYALLDRADIVVAHNARKFDIPVIYGRGMVHGIRPPSPFHIVDTLIVARKELRMVTNTLRNLCEELGLPMKDDHKKFPGFKLWTECMAGNEEAWEEMKEYNIQDIVSLEALYDALLPYMRHHPNIARDTGEFACPKCASENIQRRGYYYTKAGLAYPKFVCNDCGGWGRGNAMTKDLIKSTSRNAV